MAQTENVDPNSNQLDPSLLQQGQSVFNQQGEEFVVVNADPTNTEKIIMPKNQQNAETPDGVETVDDQNLVNNFYLQSNRTRTYDNMLRRKSENFKKKTYKLPNYDSIYHDIEIQVETYNKNHPLYEDPQYIKLSDYGSFDEVTEEIDKLFGKYALYEDVEITDHGDLPNVFIESDGSIDSSFWDFLYGLEDLESEEQEAIILYASVEGIPLSEDSLFSSFEEAYEGEYKSMRDYAISYVNDNGTHDIENDYDCVDEDSVADYLDSMEGAPEGMSSLEYARERIEELGPEYWIGKGHIDFDYLAGEFEHNYYEVDGFVFRKI